MTARYRPTTRWHFPKPLGMLIMLISGTASADIGISQAPLFLTDTLPPKVMLVLSKDHEMFKEAYPDYSDLTGNGAINNTYTDTFEYYGYFDPNTCYDYETDGNDRFEPEEAAVGPNNHYCTDGDDWSGNFLNWATMTRMDIVRRVLYGGKRTDDTEQITILERALIPNSAHAFVKIYDGSDLDDLTPYDDDAISICNVTWKTSDRSDQVDTDADEPTIRVARGSWPTWAATEVKQCAWRDEKAGGSPNSAHPTDSGYYNDALGTFDVLVEVCRPGIAEAHCKSYPGDQTNGTLKPTGLIHEFGEDGRIDFGLLTGSYEKNTSGGVLRRNIGPITGNSGSLAGENEIDPDTGIFLNNGPSDQTIVNAINRLRITHWNYSGNSFSDNCNNPGISSITDNKCTSWGNPVGEMMLEALRYFSGAAGPTSAFDTGSSDSRLSGLPRVSAWRDPLPQDGYCANPSVILLSSGVTTHDGGNEAQFGNADDIAGLSGASAVDTRTDEVGDGEGLSGSYILGGTGKQCTAESIDGLSDALGICPQGGSLLGGYSVAGLAKHGWTNDIRPEHPRDQNVKTFAINLAEPLPRLRFGQIELFPTCQSSSNGTNYITCNAIQTDVLDVEYDNDGNLVAGHFRTFWEDSSYGSDYDMDGASDLLVCVGDACPGNVDDGDVRVTVNVVQAIAGYSLRFGFLTTGSTTDGLSDWVYRPGNQNFSVIVDPADNPGRQPDPMTQTLTPGTSSAGLLRDPLWYAAKWGGFDKSLGDTPSQSEQWDLDGDGSPDNYFLVRNPAKLEENLSTVFSEIAAAIGSASAISTNATRLSTSTLVYQARFNSEDWSGELLAYEVNEGDGSVSANPEWNAADEIPLPGNRSIFTRNSDSGDGVAFQWANLSNAQQSALGGEPILEWLRGDRSDANLRQMSGSLSDIVNSNPTFSATEDFGFDALDGLEGSSYAAYLTGKSDRTPAVYVGSNGGMLHAFDAENGDELFAYVPEGIYADLGELPLDGYSHRYYVDGSPRVFDARVSATWRTLLIGSVGAGGKSVFLLDISTPSSFTAGDVLWEMTGDENNDLVDHFGVSVPEPTIARMQDGSYWAIIGNGYNSSEGTAALILQRVDGTLGSNSDFVLIDTEAGASGDLGKNGLSSPIPVDIDGDRTTDYIYAGDLHGNMWRFDVDSANTNQWDVAFKQGNTPKPLFTAVDSDEEDEADPQAITARPEVGRHPDGGQMVYFGTGAFFRTGDDQVGADDTRHSFYGIHDNDETVSRDELTLQTIVYEGEAPGFGVNVRAVSTNERAADDKGFVLDLISPENGFEGERVVSEAQIRFGRIVFSTLIPSPSPCEFGGTSWLMELDAIDGGNFGRSIFDLNDDDNFDDQDYVDAAEGDEDPLMLPVSGLGSEIGIINKPSIITAGEVEYKYTSGSSGDIGVIKEISGTDELGRQSWRQLQ